MKDKFSIGNYGHIAIVIDTEGNAIGLHTMSQTFVRGCIERTAFTPDAHLIWRDRFATVSETHLQDFMGMFDTIHFKAPVPCSFCGTGILSLQTHCFDDVMADYHIGSLVPSSVHMGVIKETLWCDACFREKRAQEPPQQVFIVIWHSVLVGVETSAERAEARLAAVDRLDLLGWLDDAQREATRWRRRFHALNNDVFKWHEHLAEVAKGETEGDAPDQEQRRRRWAIFSLPEEILAAPDPLGAILEKHKPESAEGDDW